MINPIIHRQPHPYSYVISHSPPPPNARRPEAPAKQGEGQAWVETTASPCRCPRNAGGDPSQLGSHKHFPYGISILNAPVAAHLVRGEPPCQTPAAAAAAAAAARRRTRVHQQLDLRRGHRGVRLGWQPRRPGRGRGASTFLDENRRCICQSQSTRPPKRTQRPPHHAARRPSSSASAVPLDASSTCTNARCSLATCRARPPRELLIPHDEDAWACVRARGSSSRTASACSSPCLARRYSADSRACSSVALPLSGRFRPQYFVTRTGAT
jgi:hypothetical protein